MGFNLRNRASRLNLAQNQYQKAWLVSWLGESSLYGKEVCTRLNDSVIIFIQPQRLEVRTKQVWLFIILLIHKNMEKLNQIQSNQKQDRIFFPFSHLNAGLNPRLLVLSPLPYHMSHLSPIQNKKLCFQRKTCYHHLLDITLL